MSKVENFLRANARSPVVYGSVDDNGVTYRLRDGKMFEFGAKVARAIGAPRWAFEAAE